ncbi:uncharacterized protein [Pithys albifrons albifrons]|uniref:uncharacterized protein n=1 Tax=Pithys albifrons albifrons TaxID=3385563 RepID=UPI003A5CB43D
MDRARGTDLLTHFCINTLNTQPGQDPQEVQEYNTGPGYDSRQRCTCGEAPAPPQEIPHNQHEASGKSEPRENGIKKVNLKKMAYGAPLNAEACQIPLPPEEKRGLLTALIWDLGLLKDIDNVDYLDFYTPNDMEECGNGTLHCYQRELTLLEKELEGENQRHLENIQKNLNCLKKNILPGTGCKRCEAHDKTKFPEFHQELLSVLQSMLKEVL